MPGNVKHINIAWSATGLTVYAIIIRELDGYLLDDADGGVFADAPADPYVALTENATLKGHYELSESRQPWDDGWYLALVYKQNGASPSPADDTVIGSARFYVQDDLETTMRDIATVTDKFLFDVNSNVKSTRTYETGAVVDDSANGSYSFKTDLTEAVNDYWVGSYLKFTSGALSGQVKKILSYTAATGIIALTASLTGTPAIGDTFKLINE
jgi:hypothetical protein